MAIAMSRRRCLQHGVTLIELMVAVAIVAILASIALPSYQQYRLRANRSDCKECLIEAQRRMEEFFSRRNVYAQNLSSLGYDSDTQSCAGGLYSASVAAASASCPISRCYTLTATAQGKQTADGDLRIIFDSSQVDPGLRNRKQRRLDGTWQSSWD